jgi:rhodanese-related sulfurtransferase
MSTPEQTEIEIDPRRAAELVSAGDAVLVDVRTDDEHDAGAIGGATHIELGELPARAHELPGDDRALVFYCRVGGRSLMAAQALRASGREAYSMAGGIIAWVADGRPLDSADARIADH